MASCDGTFPHWGPLKPPPGDLSQAVLKFVSKNCGVNVTYRKRKSWKAKAISITGPAGNLQPAWDKLVEVAANPSRHLQTAPGVAMPGNVGGQNTMQSDGTMGRGGGCTMMPDGMTNGGGVNSMGMMNGGMMNGHMMNGGMMNGMGGMGMHGMGMMNGMGTMNGMGMMDGMGMMNGMCGMGTMNGMMMPMPMAMGGMHGGMVPVAWAPRPVMMMPPPGLTPTSSHSSESDDDDRQSEEEKSTAASSRMPPTLVPAPPAPEVQKHNSKKEREPDHRGNKQNGARSPQLTAYKVGAKAAGTVAASSILMSFGGGRSRGEQRRRRRRCEGEPERLDASLRRPRKGDLEPQRKKTTQASTHGASEDL